MVAVPAAMPVTVPVVKPIVATKGLLLVQEPPVVISDKVVEEPAQIVVVPVMDDIETTVIGEIT